jgi:RND superfamily putative drug exporter
MLAALARFSVRHRRIMVFGIWIPALVIVGVLSGRMGSDFSTQFELPKSEANDVQKLLESNSPSKAGFSGEIVFASPNGVNSDDVVAALAPFFDKVDALQGVTVTSPFSETSQGQINQAGTTGFASLDVSLRSQSELIELSKEIQDLGNAVNIDGLAITRSHDHLGTCIRFCSCNGFTNWNSPYRTWCGCVPRHHFEPRCSNA